MSQVPKKYLILKQQNCSLLKKKQVRYVLKHGMLVSAGLRCSFPGLCWSLAGLSWSCADPKLVRPAHDQHKPATQLQNLSNQHMLFFSITLVINQYIRMLSEVSNYSENWSNR